MKKSFLPIMMVLMSQSTIFCMEITPKTIKSSTMQSHAMTYPLKNGTEIIVSPDAVALCQQLNFSKEDFDLLFAGKKLGVIPFTFDLSDDEAVIFFKILNTISQDATKTMDGGYVTQHVYTIVNNALHNLSNESLARIVGVSDFLICPTVLNALIAIIIEKSEVIEAIGNIYSKQPDIQYAIIAALHKNGFDVIHEGLMPLLIKHFKRVNLGYKLGIHIKEYSLLDYIALQEVPQLVNLSRCCAGQMLSGYDFMHANLTSLEGLEYLQNYFEYVEAIDFSHNFLELAGLTPENSFKYFPKIKCINLSYNHLTQCHPQLFNNARKLDVLNLSHNNIAFLDSFIFKPIKELGYLYLSYNNFSYLDSDIFFHLTMLEELALDHNKLTALSPILFSKLLVLDTLNLSDNMITVLPNGIFDGLRLYLDILDLSNNQLTYISLDLFESLENLSELNVDGNPLIEENKIELEEFIDSL